MRFNCHRTSLHWACQNGHIEVATLLLRNGMVRPSWVPVNDSPL